MNTNHLLLALALLCALASAAALAAGWTLSHLTFFFAGLCLAVVVHFRTRPTKTEPSS